MMSYNCLNNGSFSNNIHFKYWRLICSTILVLSLSTSIAWSAVVKSAGVKRIVDAPQGEVVSDSLLDDFGTAVPPQPPTANSSNSISSNHMDSQISGNNYNSSSSAPDHSDIKYQDPNPISSEDIEQEEKSNLPIMIIAGILILCIGSGAVLYINKRDQ